MGRYYTQSESRVKGKDRDIDTMNENNSCSSFLFCSEIPWLGGDLSIYLHTLVSAICFTLLISPKLILVQDEQSQNISTDS